MLNNDFLNLLKQLLINFAASGEFKILIGEIFGTNSEIDSLESSTII
jgi:hypothetical protein